ncbi:GNAT family N-acetyltransferase [Patescibacteria group bacterium]|nr:GNAT family N-acetyltransferase [Patescibacteria group bacterium]
MIKINLAKLNNTIHNKINENLSVTSTIFQTYDFLKIWTDNFPIDYRILEIYEDNQQVGYLPVSIEDNQIEILGTTAVLGNEQVTDFGDISSIKGKENQVWQVILEYLKKNYSGYKLTLNFIRESSPSFNILKKYQPDPVKVATSPYIKLPKSWDEYLNGLKRKSRQELKRKMRRLEALNYKNYFAEKDDNNIKTFLNLMKKSSNEKNSFLTDKMEVYFRQLMQNFDKKRLLLWFMEIGNKVVASVIVFRFKNQIQLYNSGVDTEYNYYSVGLLSKAFLIKWAIENGFEIYDFLQGNERYKYDLGAVNNPLYKFEIIL